MSSDSFILVTSNPSPGVAWDHLHPYVIGAQWFAFGDIAIGPFLFPVFCLLFLCSFPSWLILFGQIRLSLVIGCSDSAMRAHQIGSVYHPLPDPKCPIPQTQLYAIPGKRSDIIDWQFRVVIGRRAKKFPNPGKLASRNGRIRKSRRLSSSPVMSDQESPWN